MNKAYERGPKLQTKQHIHAEQSPLCWEELDAKEETKLLIKYLEDYIGLNMSKAFAQHFWQYPI